MRMRFCENIVASRQNLLKIVPKMDQKPHFSHKMWQCSHKFCHKWKISVFLHLHKDTLDSCSKIIYYEVSSNRSTLFFKPAFFTCFHHVVATFFSHIFRNDSLQGSIHLNKYLV